MPNLPFRFRKGQGLELSGAEKTQAGYLRLENVVIDQRDVVAKRPGAVNVPSTTTSDPDSELPVEDLRAVWHLNNELVLESNQQIYSRRECAGDGTVTLGTATPGEIAQAQAALLEREQSSYSVTIPLVAEPSTATAYSRTNRENEVFDTIVYTSPAAVNINARLTFTAPELRLEWDGGVGVVPGSVLLGTMDANVQMRHFQRPSDTQLGRVWFTSSGGVNRSRINNFLILANDFLDGAAMVVQPLATVTNVYGTPDSCCSDGDGEGVVYIRENASNEPVIGLFDATETDLWTIDPAFHPFIEAGTGGYIYESRADAPIGTGPRIAVAPFPEGQTTQTQVLYFSLPQVPAGNVTPTSYQDGALALATDQLGVGFSLADDVVAHLMAVVEGALFSYKLSGSTWFYNDVDFGDLVYEYTLANIPGIPATSIPVRRRRINTPLLRTDVLGTESTEAKGLQVVDQGTGHHLVAFKSAGSLSDVVVIPYGVIGEIASPAVVEQTLAQNFALDEAPGPLWGYVYTDGSGTTHQIRWTNDLTVPFSTDSVSLPVFVGPDTIAAVSLTLQDIGGGDADVRVAQWITSLRTLYSYSLDTSTSDITVVRNDPISSFQSVVSAHVQLGTYPRIIWAARNIDTGFIEVYEIDSDLFVRVSPGTVGLAGGNWTPRGPWTRGRMRIVQTQDWGEQTVFLATAAAVRSPATGDPCILELLEMDPASSTNLGVQVLVYSTHAESGGVPNQVVIDTQGVAPHVVGCDDDTVALTYVTQAAEVFFQFWSPGESFILADSGVTVHDTANPLCDLTGGSLASGLAYYGLIVRDAADDNRIQIRDSDGNILSEFIDSLSGGVLAEAVAIYAYPDDQAVDPTFVTAVVGDIGGAGYRIEIRVFRTQGGGPVTFWNFEFDAGAVGEVVKAVTVGGDTPADLSSTALVSVEVQVGTELEVRTYEVISDPPNPTTAQLIRTDYRSAIYGSYVERAKQLVFFESSIEGFSPTITRNGIFCIAPRTGEIVQRIDFGTCEGNNARSNRTQVSDSNVFEDTLLVLGYAVETGARVGELTASKYVSWDNASRPNFPAISGNVAVSAHAGYPRLYDSAVVCEQDWHELPSIKIVAPIVGALEPGEYGVAVSYVWFDARGKKYRSAPFFRQITLTVISAIRVTSPPLQRTERFGVQLEVWRTLVNGAAYYRVTTVDAVTAGDADIVVDLTEADAAIDQNEVLDQVPGVLQPSQVGRVTDWMSNTDQRLWSRDPERSELCRFSTVEAEGRAPHWPLVQGVTIPTTIPATGVVELDGRIVLFSSNDVSYTATGGPDDAGNGAYPSPSLIPSSTGLRSYETLARTPDGYVYGTTNTPYILTRGMQTLEYSDQVYAPYEIDGEVAVVSVWRPDRRNLVMSNGATGRLLLFNRSTQRWAEVTGRPSLDLSLSSRQEFVSLLNDGRILVEDDETTLFTDGDTPFQLLVSTPWFHPPRQDGLVHSTLNISTVMIWGTWEGEHAPLVNVYLNYSDTPFTAQSVPASRVTQNETDGKPYLYVAAIQAGPAYAARVEVSDSSEPNATFRLEGIDVEVEIAGSGPTTLNLEHQFE